MFNKIIQAIYSNLILTQYLRFAIHEIHSLIFKKINEFDHILEPHFILSGVVIATEKPGCYEEM